MNIKKSLLTYYPGILFFLILLIIGLVTYKDYGMSWDEPAQRNVGLANYNYAATGDPYLFTFIDKEYGAGFELPLIYLERQLHLTDERDIYQMRHLVTHIFFLFSMFLGYLLVYRLFKDQFIACLGFFMLACAPTIYAHSFFNTKDLPFLSMTVISFAVCQLAFDKNKLWLFALLGLICGYTTGIRIMGIMVGGLVALALIFDLIIQSYKKENVRNPISNVLTYIIGFCIALYVSCPYLWRDPLGNFGKSYSRMAHFVCPGTALFRGKVESCSHLPISYLPWWFMITNPLLWLFAGFAGIALLFIHFYRKPFLFITNTTDRNFLFYFLCFVTPVISVICLHSVIYDGWRHLYFIYPSFVLLALYFINKVYKTRSKLLVVAACMVQVICICDFMIKYHPAQQVYFNDLVAHDKEHLRKNYEFDYWGPCYLQGLNFLVNKVPVGPIKLSSCEATTPLLNNILMLKKEDRQRIEIVDCDKADYFITNFRWHAEDFPNHVEYSLTVLNSTVVCVYSTGNKLK